MKRRLGSQMAIALNYIDAHPGTAIRPVALLVGPHGSLKYGYATVHRLIRAGFVIGVKSRGRWSLTGMPLTKG